MESSYFFSVAMIIIIFVLVFFFEVKKKKLKTKRNNIMECFYVIFLLMLSVMVIIATMIYVNNRIPHFNMNQYPAKYIKSIGTIDSQYYHRLKSTRVKRQKNSDFATLEKKLEEKHTKIIEHLKDTDEKPISKL
ncbi:MAG: hypothetical protein GY793_08195 [Proteobacteria bacterium]|nr:hypothetical protein [Pseudomonadota bacterium]